MDLRDHQGRLVRSISAIAIAVPLALLVVIGGDELVHGTTTDSSGRAWFAIMTFAFSFALIAFAVHAWLSSLAKRVPLRPALPRASLRERAGAAARRTHR